MTASQRGMSRHVATFYRRRIAIPVDRDALVLDVGSGDKPHWRADVLLDKFTDADHGGQRSGHPKVRVSRPLFDADVADMPFDDGVFDYVICSHTLEHVVDPAAAVAEITRVGKAGYIELPEAGSAKILDFPSHLWWCSLDGSTLVFKAKESRAFDPEIAGYIEMSGIEKQLERLLDKEFEYRIIGLPWEGHVDVRVEGTPDPLFVATALDTEVAHRVGQTFLGHMLTGLMSFPHRSQKRKEPVRHDEIVKPEFRTGTDERLERRIYRVGDSATSSS